MFNCPIRHPSRDASKNTIPYLNQVITKKRVYLRCPAQFCTFWNEIFTMYLKRTCKCTPSHPFFVFVFSHVIVTISFFFTYLWIGHTCTSLEKKKTERDGILKVRCIRNIVTKKSSQNMYDWAGHSQSTVLAALWLAQLVSVSNTRRSARYARSQGRMERNDRCSRWSNIWGANRRPANVKSSMLQENNPDAAGMLHVLHIYFFWYFDVLWSACT